MTNRNSLMTVLALLVSFSFAAMPSSAFATNNSDHEYCKHDDDDDDNNCGKGPKGDKGDKGDKGNTGPAGPQGPKGDTGPAGPKGDTGATGPKGLVGPQGPAGASGAQGATGAQGPKGDKGYTGTTGQAGANGIDGAPGADGAAGQDGEQGPQGEPGLDGALSISVALATLPADPAGSAFVLSDVLQFIGNQSLVTITPETTALLATHTLDATYRFGRKFKIKRRTVSFDFGVCIAVPGSFTPTPIGVLNTYTDVNRAKVLVRRSVPLTAVASDTAASGLPLPGVYEVGLCAVSRSVTKPTLFIRNGFTQVLN